MKITDRKIVRKIYHKVKKAIDEQYKSHKLVYVGTAKWTNALTKQEEKVSGIYILGFESSWKPVIINRITLRDNEDTTEYVMNDWLCHTNICDEESSYRMLLMIDGKAYEATLYGQNFCNPLTADHVFNGDEEDTKGMIRVNLISQNFNDPYCTPRSVQNSEFDKILEYDITRNNSPIEMLTGYPAYRLNQLEQTELNEMFRRLLEINEKEIYTKPKYENAYVKIDKNEYRRNRDKYSNYYPAYNYNQIQALGLELPKENYDIGMFGLGSAGTAILDQLCRSNWIKKVYLCDFDTVENKNLINQWYTNNDITDNKAYACAKKLQSMARTINNIATSFEYKVDQMRFEDTKYKERKFKYVVSGFDSIAARELLFNEVKNNELETQYLIDCRYLDLAGSVYIIDTSDKDQMDFYEQNLLADKELLEQKLEKAKMNKDQFHEWFRKMKEEYSCGYLIREYFRDQQDEITNNCCNHSCRELDCEEEFYKAYLESYPNKKIHSENTCVKQNYIDIYKYIGAIVFGTIRKIEDEQPKPFTLLEAQTDVKGLPNYMIVKE